MGSCSWGLKQWEEVLRVYVYVCVYSEDEKENHQVRYIYIYRRKGAQVMK